MVEHTAVELAGLLAAGEVSAREVTAAHLERLAAVGPSVNAVVTVTAEAAMHQAGLLDDQFARSGPVGPLHGLPVAHKDLAETRGVRTTYGSMIFADNVPDIDALHVARMREAGAVSLGKTNTPEFGAGSHTFNEIFGVTRNPYDLSKTSGGSSGGPRPLSPRAWSRWPTAATWAGRCATPRRSATSSGCGPPRAGCRCGRRATPGHR